MIDLRNVFIDTANLSLKAFIYSIPIGLFIGIIHESGHALICVSTGGSFLWTDFFQFHLRCSSLPVAYDLLYWALGGIFGIILSSIFLIFKKTRNEKKYLIAVLTMFFLQIMNLIVETMYHKAYFDAGVNGLMLISTIVVFLSLSTFFTVRTKSKS